MLIAPITCEIDFVQVPKSSLVGSASKATTANGTTIESVLIKIFDLEFVERAVSLINYFQNPSKTTSASHNASIKCQYQPITREAVFLFSISSVLFVDNQVLKTR